MSRQQAAKPQRSKVRLHIKVRGHPFGVYTWRRYRSGGVVMRLGPIGHVQAQHYRCKLIGPYKDNRRGAHGVALHWWGVSGRRRKRGIELRMML